MRKKKKQRMKKEQPAKTNLIIHRPLIRYVACCYVARSPQVPLLNSTVLTPVTRCQIQQVTAPCSSRPPCSSHRPPCRYGAMLKSPADTTPCSYRPPCSSRLPRSSHPRAKPGAVGISGLTKPVFILFWFFILFFYFGFISLLVANARAAWTHCHISVSLAVNLELRTLSGKLGQLRQDRSLGPHLEFSRTRKLFSKHERVGDIPSTDPCQSGKRYRVKGNWLGWEQGVGRGGERLIKRIILIERVLNYYFFFHLIK